MRTPLQSTARTHSLSQHRGVAARHATTERLFARAHSRQIRATSPCGPTSVETVGKPWLRRFSCRSRHWITADAVSLTAVDNEEVTGHNPHAGHAGYALPVADHNNCRTPCEAIHTGDSSHGRASAPRGGRPHRARCLERLKKGRLMRKAGWPCYHFRARAAARVTRVNLSRRNLSAFELDCRMPRNAQATRNALRPLGGTAVTSPADAVRLE